MTAGRPRGTHYVVEAGAFVGLAVPFQEAPDKPHAEGGCRQRIRSHIRTATQAMRTETMNAVFGGAGDEDE